MIDFGNIEYLRSGNEKQCKAFELLESMQVMFQLAAFDPVLVGTIPIRIDIAGSDLDIICYWEEKHDFKEKINQLFSQETGFRIREAILHGQEAVIANFSAGDFEIEFFGQNIPVKAQFGYRHMLIEHDILESKGETFRQEIIALKRKGYKTEPAFALLLGITGNPYLGLLEYTG